MSVPTPLNALSGHCSAIFDNTLFVLNNEGALQSLPLKQNATWSQEENALPVQNPACVTASNSLYVIGGASDDTDYRGLQKYMFEEKRWNTLHPTADVLQTRTDHGVAYLEDSQSILIYAGSTVDTPSTLSSQTFLLSTQPPYNVRAFTSHAPPANNPILTPWNSSHAVMLGGQEFSPEIWLFGPDEGWSPLSTNLTEPLDPSSRAALVDGDDGSKVLQVYSFNVSPNTAEAIVLLGEDGRPAYTGQKVETAPSLNNRKRDISANNWPPYNGTDAPKSTRTDCSIARTPDGLVVMAGGNDEEPIIMFNQTENTWVNPDLFFHAKQQVPLQPSATPDPVFSATPSGTTAAATSSAAGAPVGPSAHDKTMRTLGITLGVLCGLAALFILILLYLRWRKLKAKKNQVYPDEKNVDGAARRMSFQDRGASFMKEAGLSSQTLPPPHPNYSENPGSHSSMAIIAGHWGNGSKTNHSAKDSYESTAALVKHKNGQGMPAEDHEMTHMGDRDLTASSSLTVPGAVAKGGSLNGGPDRPASSGWSKYFAANQPTGPDGVSHIPSVYIKPGHSNSIVDRESNYSVDIRDSSHTSQIPSSALVPPLDIDFTKTADGQRLSHVVMGSPAYMDSREDLARTGSPIVASHGQRGQIVDPRDSQITDSTFDNRSTISSNVASDFNDVQTPWTPMVAELGQNGRSTSSVYTETPRVPSRGRSTGFFPGAGTSYKPNKTKMGQSAGPNSDWAAPRAPGLSNQSGEARDSTATEFPGADYALATPAKKIESSSLPFGSDLAPPRAPGLSLQPAEARDSTVTVFPGADYLDGKQTGSPRLNNATGGAMQQSKPSNTDMSWLNLGLTRSHS
jgi:hypothetical protein